MDKNNLSVEAIYNLSGVLSQNTQLSYISMRAC